MLHYVLEVPKRLKTLKLLRKIEAYRGCKGNRIYRHTVAAVNFPSRSGEHLFHTTTVSPDKIMATSSPIDATVSDFFKGTTDRFGGVTVDSQSEPRDESSFEQCLTDSLSVWQSSGVRGCWFNVHLEQTHWVPVLAKHQFTYHHAEGTNVMMVKWLPSDQPDKIPKYAHTVVGVGAMVVREDTQEVLVVREKYHKQPHWKLPGGYVEKNEDLSTAAAREVLEETGIQTEFVSIIATRHTHQAAFGCSDFYYIVLMRPLSSEITMCTQELAACLWMQLSEYRNHPLVHETNRFFVDAYLQSKEKGVSIGGTPLFSSVMKKNQIIYSLDFESKGNSNDNSTSKKLKTSNGTENNCDTTQ